MRDLTSLLAGRLLPRLESAKLKITYACNLRCRMCGYWRSEGRDELSTAEWQRVIDELAALGCRKVHFSGGEPTLRPDWLELIAHAARRKLRTAFTTNGTRLTNAQLKELIRLRVRAVSLSLDAPTARAHDALRGKRGAFRAARRVAAALARLNRRSRRPLKLRINMVVMAANYREIPAMLGLAHDWGAEDVVMMPVDARGTSAATSSGAETAGLRLNARQVEEYNRRIRPVVKWLREQHGFSTEPETWDLFPGTAAAAARGEYAGGHYEEHACHMPWRHLFIGARGDVHPCCMLHNQAPPLGNVRRQPLSELFSGESFAAFRRALLRRRTAACARCDQFLAENRAGERELAQSAPRR